MSLLGLGFLVACGGSASRQPDALQPDGMGGAADDSAGGDKGGTAATGAVGFAGGSATGATGGVIASGGTTPQGFAGTAGADALPPLELPSGCEARGRIDKPDSCSLAVYCDTISQLTSCQRLASGRWQCQCDSKPGQIFQTENAPGLQACALAATLCSEDRLELGEESCEPASEVSSEISCNIDLACSKPIELDSEKPARAWLTRLGSGFCQLAESGKSFECGCTSSDVASEYDLLVASGDPDCRSLVEFCMSGKTPDFDGEQECLLTNAVSTGEGCERSEICAASMPLTGEVSLADVEPRYANCTPGPGGGATCYCSGRTSVFSFQLAAAPDDATCESSILNCAEDVEIEATGAATCQPTSMTAFADSCESDLGCTQNATVDEREIVAEGRLLVSCARAQPGMPWWCSCASDQETARFQLGEPELTPWEVCGQAPDRCLEQLAVHVGPYGELVQPPYPLPEPL